MATKDDLFVDETPKEAPAPKEKKVVAPDPAPVVEFVDPGLVTVVNGTRTELDITLRDGTNLRVGPWSRDGKRNTSKPVLRTLLPPYVLRLVKEGSLTIVGGNK
jgi:hypothetical protein